MSNIDKHWCTTKQKQLRWYELTTREGIINNVKVFTLYKLSIWYKTLVVDLWFGIKPNIDSNKDFTMANCPRDRLINTVNDIELISKYD